jgi:16S rRNA (adenine1518-N6/adenine1519-N6)-dimethyltransferase
VKRAVLMVQKEMADRIVAKPGGKEYGALGVMVQAFAEASMVTRVSAGSFVPPPKVESAVIRLTPKETIDVGGDERHFSKVVHAGFGQRRKTLRNALRAAFPEEHVDAALAATAIDGQRRAETLALAEFVALARAITKAPDEPGPKDPLDLVTPEEFDA